MLIPEFATVTKAGVGEWMVEHAGGCYIPELYAGPHGDSEEAREALVEWAIKYHVILAVAKALERSGAEDLIAEVLTEQEIELEDAVAVLRENYEDELAEICFCEI